MHPRIPGTLIGSMPVGGMFLRFSFVELGFHLVIAQADRRTSAAINSVKFVFLRVVNDGEKITADSIRDRLHQTKRRIRCDRRIDCAAATFQNLNTDLCRRWHARANHSVSAEHFRPRCEIFSGDPIDLGEPRVRPGRSCANALTRRAVPQVFI